MTYPVITSFYTNTWNYAKYAEKLITSCERLGLEYHIKELPDTGSWISNTAIKAAFISATMDTLDRPLLWIDADGMLLKLPEILKLPAGYDFAGRHQRTGPKRNWHVGTLFFNNTPNAKELIRLWGEFKGTGSDEAAFDAVWNTHAEKLGVSSIELPAEYFEILPNETRSPKCNTVIAHRLSRCESKLEMKARKKS